MYKLYLREGTEEVIIVTVTLFMLAILWTSSKIGFLYILDKSV